jgi:methionyl-tRNA formyltransferase
MHATPVCQAAVCANLRVIKATRLKDQALFDQIEALKPDLFVVIAFRILPQRLIDLPRLGAMNIHASLLPKYRGAAPINWALINGEKETGLTSFFLKRKVDTGDVILQEAIPIEDDDNFDSLHDRLCEKAGPFLLKTLDLIEKGEAPLMIQDDSLATPAPKITPFDAMIDFGFPAAKVGDFVRGLSSRPGAFTHFRGSKLKIIKAAAASDDTLAADAATISETTRPGTIIRTRKKLLVACADSALELLQVVPEGKKAMDGPSFINGFKPKVGEILGEMTMGAKEK